MKKKPKKKKSSYHPDIIAAAKVANQRTNEHLQALRDTGYKTKVLKGTRENGETVEVGVGADLPLDFSEWMTECASIIAEVRTLSGE